MNEGRALQGSPFLGPKLERKSSSTDGKILSLRAQKIWKSIQIIVTCAKAIPYCRYERGLYPEIGTLEKVDNL